MISGIVNSDKFLALVASDDIHGDSGDVCKKKICVIFQLIIAMMIKEK